MQKLNIKNKSMIPIVQGGMGVAISASSLAGAVAKENGIGTIASVDLRHLHEDLLNDSKINPTEEKYNKLNHIALDREIKQAKINSTGNGMIAVNVMKAVKDHKALVNQACESGANAIVMGAGLPLDLPEMTSNFPDIALMPILSESRGIGLVLKRWMKKNKLPDAIVIENPAYAAGHLGAAKIDDLNQEQFNFERVITETFEIFKKMGIERENIPLIVAGGMAKFEKIRTALTEWGASAVQIGTAFAITKEGDAHMNFKKTLMGADVKEQIVEFMSVAGLPARGIKTKFLDSYLKREEILQKNAKADQKRCTQGINCLSVCGLRDGIEKMGQFCIDLKLASAFRGEVDKGLFFRGKEALPIELINQNLLTVKETINYLLFNNNLKEQYN